MRIAWLELNWPYAGAIVLVFLVALLPLIIDTWHIALVFVYLLLIIYLIHQIEEHFDDRFRRFVNANLANGVDVLSRRTTMWINIGLVWAVYLAALLLAQWIDPGLGLIAVYATLFNAVAHMVTAIVLRRYQPGLWTAIVLFLPVGGLAWSHVTEANGIGAAAHVVGLAVAILGHAAIMVVVGRNVAALKKGLR